MGYLCSASAIGPDTACHHHGHECSICLEAVEGNDALETNCGHVFHHDCISEALLHSEDCPNCRSKVYELQNSEDKARKAKRDRALRQAARELRDAEMQILAREYLRQRLLRRSREARREVQRMREEGFSHHVDAEQATIDYHRRVELRRQRPLLASGACMRHFASAVSAGPSAPR